jgi:putative nucleotidyltransferase with HDIG domain
VAGQNQQESMMRLPEAFALAQRLLDGCVPQRWEHSLGVLRQAEAIASILGEDAELLAVSAILHDVGYAPEAVKTGQHMLDGACYLAEVVGAHPLICSVIAYHSSSRWESVELGLSSVLERFEPPAAILEDAITYCDLSTSPCGVEVSASERLADVFERYGPGHVVFRSVSAARPFMLASVERIAALRRVAASSETMRERAHPCQ